MCDSTLHRVTEVIDHARIVAQDVNGARHQVSLLAFDGETPAVGTWLVVHSGYAIDRVEEADASAAIAELRRAGVIDVAPFDTEITERNRSQ